MADLTNFTTAQLRAEIFRRVAPNFPPENNDLLPGASPTPRSTTPGEYEATFAELEEHLTMEMGNMVKAMKTIASVLNPERATEVIVEEITSILSADRATIFRVDESTGDLLIKIASGMAPIRIPKDKKSIATSVAASCEPVIINDVYNHPLFDPTQDKKTGYKTESMLAVPATDSSGKAVAVLQVVNKTDGSEFNDLDVVLAQNVAAMAGIVLRNCDEMEKSVQNEKRAVGVIDIISVLKGDINPNSIMFTVNRRVQDLADAEKSTFFVADHQRKLLLSATTDSGVQIKIPITAGLVGSCVADGDMINIPDAYEDDRFDKSNDEKTGFVTRSILCAPITRRLENGEKEVFAVIQLINKRKTPFDYDDEKVIGEICSLISEKLDPDMLLETFAVKNTSGKAFSAEEEAPVFAMSDSRGKIGGGSGSFNNKVGKEGPLGLGPSPQEAKRTSRKLDGSLQTIKDVPGPGATRPSYRSSKQFKPAVTLTEEE